MLNIFLSLLNAISIVNQVLIEHPNFPFAVVFLSTLHFDLAKSILSYDPENYVEINDNLEKALNV